MEATITRVTETIEIIVIRTLLYLEVLDAIPAQGSVSLTDIASATSAQPSLLERLLRTVFGTEGLSKTENGDYSHTPESLTYTLGGGAFLEMFHDKVVIPFSIFPEYLEAKRHNLGGSSALQRLKIRLFTGVYDFDRLTTPDDPDRIVLVDVGGGQDHEITKILEVHPNIRPEQCVLQDRKKVIASPREESGLPSGVKCMVHDFYTLQPIEKARAYHFGAIAHDLSDINLVKILTQICPDSKVLISEQVVPERGASGFVKLMDMGMLAIGGKERTKENLQEVLDEAGLKIDRIWKAKEGYFSVIEARFK
ncbi:MAG: hypothetical protein FE78DRAFT_103943 [Acidomyces sp. 'richmondensis']|nr:MAG: hypothetical protein FE78DRAFT_103943 [Acidomyces sp. 'richmondensis']